MISLENAELHTRCPQGSHSICRYDTGHDITLHFHTATLCMSYTIYTCFSKRQAMAAVSQQLFHTG